MRKKRRLRIVKGFRKVKNKLEQNTALDEYSKDILEKANRDVLRDAEEMRIAEELLDSTSE